MKKHISHLNVSMGMLLVRLGVGGIFLSHGWSKLTNMEGTIAFFGQLGFDPLIAYVVAIAELLGGISMILGIFTRWSGVGLALIMLGALFLVKFKNGFSGEFELLLLLTALGISFSGPGKYSLERTFYNHE